VIPDVWRHSGGRPRPRSERWCLFGVKGMYFPAYYSQGHDSFLGVSQAGLLASVILGLWVRGELLVGGVGGG